MNNVLIALIISILFIVIGYLVFLIIALFSTGSLVKAWNQLKNVLGLEGAVSIVLKVIFIFLIFLCLLTQISESDHNSKFVLFIGSVIPMSAYLVFDYFIHPFIYARYEKRKNRDVDAETFLLKSCGNSFPVYVLARTIKNAYASGALKVNKTILMGAPLKEGLSATSYYAILLHEYAHCKQNHVLNSFIIRIVCVTIAAAFYPYFLSFFENKMIGGLLYAAVIISQLTISIPMLYQRKCEKQADTFAAEIIGVPEYTIALRALNDLTKGGLEKGSINYPTLKQRIANVEKINNKTAVA